MTLPGSDPGRLGCGGQRLVSRPEAAYDMMPGHTGRPGIIEVMNKTRSPRFPATQQLPVTRCQICDRTVAYRPGVSEVLTEHYRRVHP